jgi:hypothetical protein
LSRRTVIQRSGKGRHGRSHDRGHADGLFLIVNRQEPGPLRLFLPYSPGHRRGYSLPFPCQFPAISNTRFLATVIKPLKKNGKLANP